MEINVSKSELAGALSALGKLVCRSSPVTMYRSVKINGSDGKHLTFTVCSPDETLEYRIKTETEYDAIFAGIVPFEEFRLAVKNSKNKTLRVEQNNGKIAPTAPAFARRRRAMMNDERGEMKVCGIGLRRCDFFDLPRPTTNATGLLLRSSQ